MQSKTKPPWTLLLILALIGPMSMAAALPDFVSASIGLPADAGSSTNKGGRVEQTVRGGDIGGQRDQFQFFYEERTGDFDLETRVASLTLTDVWAKAGLMARASLNDNSAHASILATPTISGCFFQARAAAGTTALMKGSFQANHPFTWLRLERAGQILSGYASLDGRHWTLLATNALTLPDTLLVGFAMSSRASASEAAAVFEDFGETRFKSVAYLRGADEPLGPSTRRTGLAISEIMYDPSPAQNSSELEFIEIFNTLPTPQNIGGYRLAGSVSFIFPTNQVIQAGGYLVIARNPAAFVARHGFSDGVLGPLSNDLPGSGTVRLLNRSGAIYLEVEYSDRDPWPVAPDGTGHSLVLSRPSHGENNPAAWRASAWMGGSPGATDPFIPAPLSSVIFNEFFANPAPGETAFLELYNHSREPVDLSGCALTDIPGQARYRFPANTIFAPQAFLAFRPADLGFPLGPGRQNIYLYNSDLSRVIQAVRFEAQSRGVSTGQYPDGAGPARALQWPTPGEPNQAPKLPDVVINEIMYHPISDDDDDEYIELHNRGAALVNLGGWRFSAGIDFVFPQNTTIPAGGYLAVARNVSRLIANYPGLTTANTAGNFNGQLSNGGERIVLAMPAGPGLPDLITVDEVTYSDGGRWGVWSDGGGSSLELIDARSDRRMASNWADSDETKKAPWTTVEHRGVLDNGSGAIDALQLFLQGEGECLVDNVEVFGTGGTNLLSNSAFESSAASWQLQGDHDLSTLETSEGFESAQSLHVRAQDRGDTGANRIRTGIPNGRLTVGSTATIRAKVRWLKGNKEILLRLHGNHLEAAGVLQVPPNLGTPGAPNSRAVGNAGPAITEVSHWPVLPAANERVLVTARVSDPDGADQVTLNYRVEPASGPLSETTALAMTDDGLGADELARDGVFSAHIPGQLANATVAFHVEAVDGAMPAVTAKFPADAPTRDCLVRFGEVQPFGNLGTYRIWVSRANTSRWSARLKLHNGPLDATFVHGTTRAVYNIGALYAGSPFLSPGYTGPTGAPCGYEMLFPSDDKFLGATDFNLDWPIRDSSYQTEQVAYWMAEQLGLPFNNRRFIHLYVNGSKRAPIYEDTQQPSSDTISEFFPDEDEGELFKIEDWFEFGPAAAQQEFNVDATLQNFTTTGGEKKTARYRWNWRKRALSTSSHDYGRIFSLVDAVTENDFLKYTAALESLVDVDQWMRIFTIEHLVGNWDSFGYQRGKNMYAYKPEGGKWKLMMWDIDFVLGSGSDSPNTPMSFTIDPAVQRMFFTPASQRKYLQAMQAALDGPLSTNLVFPILDANHAALVANGLFPSAPNAAKTYIRSRRTSLQNELAPYSTNQLPLEVSGESQLRVPANLITLNGSARIEVNTIRVNGVAYPVLWFGANSWQIQVPVSTTASTLSIEGFDARGVLISNAVATVSVEVTGAIDSAQGNLVFNEIMHHPAVAGGEFVELLNRSLTTAFDLSGTRIDGLDFVFPAGTFLAPRASLIVVADRDRAAEAYGASVPVAGVYAGQLSPDGETLRLLAANSTPGNEIVLARASYSSASPWPPDANGNGPSLQLIDPSAPADRVGKWDPLESTCRHASLSIL